MSPSSCNRPAIPAGSIHAGSPDRTGPEALSMARRIWRNHQAARSRLHGRGARRDRCGAVGRTGRVRSSCCRDGADDSLFMATSCQEGSDICCPVSPGIAIGVSSPRRPHRPEGSGDQSPGLRELGDRCPGYGMMSVSRPEGAPEIRFASRSRGRWDGSCAPSGHGSGAEQPRALVAQAPAALG